MTKKMHTLFIINSTPLLIILLIFFSNAAPLQLSMHSIKETKPVVLVAEKPVENIVSISNGLDVQNADAGTLTLTLSMPPDRFNDAAKVILFESRFIDGLTIIYNIKDQYLEGGVPVMQSTKISLFDGKLHHVAYSYDKNHNGQLFVVDGNTIAMSQYKGKKAEHNGITAAFIGRSPMILKGTQATFDVQSLVH